MYVWKEIKANQGPFCVLTVETLEGYQHITYGLTLQVGAMIFHSNVTFCVLTVETSEGYQLITHGLTLQVGTKTLLSRVTLSPNQ